MRYQRAELCIYFNYPRPLCYWRAFKRRWANKPEASRPLGCPEQITWKLLRYMWGFAHRVAPKLAALPQQYPRVVLVEVRSAKDLAELKQQLSALTVNRSYT